MHRRKQLNDIFHLSTGGRELSPETVALRIAGNYPAGTVLTSCCCCCCENSGKASCAMTEMYTMFSHFSGQRPRPLHGLLLSTPFLYLYLHVLLKARSQTKMDLKSKNLKICTDYFQSRWMAIMIHELGLD